MKLIITITSEKNTEKLIKLLAKKGFTATILESRGIFLKEKNCTLLIACKEKEIPSILEVIKKCCAAKEEYISTPPEPIDKEFTVPLPSLVKVGGAVIMVVDLEKFEKI
jgi:uncharacterized protein YaaQ